MQFSANLYICLSPKQDCARLEQTWFPHVTDADRHQLPSTTDCTPRGCSFKLVSEQHGSFLFSPCFYNNSAQVAGPGSTGRHRVKEVITLHYIQLARILYYLYCNNFILCTFFLAWRSASSFCMSNCRSCFICSAFALSLACSSSLCIKHRAHTEHSVRMSTNT